ncbi:MAG: hypothetical protein V1751_02800 [Pseudomonadota bacterium]
MAVFVHRETQFNKLLGNLRKAGGKAALAAIRAEEIMERLATKSEFQPSHIHKLTRHGETRIQGCRKFDLGGGYRLVYLKKRDHIFFSYIGTHDDCDLWIKNNRGLQPGNNTGSCQVAVEEECKKVGVGEEQECEPEPDYDDFLMGKIDDNLLRRIFKGLGNT